MEREHDDGARAATAPSLADLVALGDRLAAAGLDEHAVVTEAARTISEVLRCAAVVFLARDDVLVPEGVHHGDPEGAALIRSIFDSVPHPTEGGLLGPVFQSGEPLIVAEVPEELLRTAYPRPEHRAYFDRFGVASLVLSPMRSTSDEVLGVVAAAAEHGRAPFTDADVLVATDLCHRVTVAIENARLHAAAAAAAARLHAIVEASADAVVTIDQHGTVISANRATEAVFGWCPSALVGRPVTTLMPATTAAEHAGFLDRYLAGGTPQVIGHRRVLEAVRADGSTFWAELSVAEIDDETGRVFTGFVRDVSDRVARQADLARLAELDPLTGALNRRALTARAHDMIVDAREHGGSVAIAFVDLDRFKAVNDAHGHRAGDEVLQIATDRIRSSIRHDDALGRWGGDEWVVVAPRDPTVDGPAEAAALAARIVGAVHGPVRVADAAAPVVLSASVGVAVHPVDGDGLDELVRRADRAMFAHKATD